MALTGRFADAAPRASTALLFVGLAGAAGGVGYGIDSIQAAVFGTESIQESDSAAASLALQTPGILFPLGLAGIGVLLARTATAPVWAAWLLAIGWGAPARTGSTPVEAPGSAALSRSPR